MCHDTESAQPSSETCLAGSIASGRSYSRNADAAAAPVRIRVVGCGRWSMGDDRAGLVVAEKLQESFGTYAAISSSEDPLDALSEPALAETDLLIVADAAAATPDHVPGSILRIDYRDKRETIGIAPRSDTHSLTVEMALELAEALGLLPPRVWIYVLFGTDFQRGMTLSRSVAAGADALVKRIGQDLREFTAACPCTS